ncbi:hypothetical protein E6W39_03990 [Kitasatospora acidiphila]|uniref:Tyr recombinase domain-containing protein n=1 Tax=Kitasatospora acidiphila TaxID=2567942 RepID=A0A540VXR4_9ACTN|nr:hypothetical protein [Kitasatospora acidiphila]TQF01556.1 hypothetical protein E6W39_03990 [Kitasatospora acidiphila]
MATELSTGERAVGAPKSEAGKHAVGIPAEIVPEFEQHLRWYAQDGDDGLLFIGERGAPYRRSTFGRNWRKARAKLGMTGFCLYGLRHTGNVLAASTGVSLRNLIAHMGHNSARGALIYQPVPAEQQAKIANVISAAVVDIRTRRRQPASAGSAPITTAFRQR